MSYDRLVIRERKVLIGGRTFRVWPPRLSRGGRAYRIRTLTLREFLDLWLGMLAAFEVKPDEALATVRERFGKIIRLSPRLIFAETISPKDLQNITPREIAFAAVAFEQVNHLEFLFSQFQGTPAKGQTGQRTKHQAAGGEKRMGVVASVAGFMRIFPAYDLAKVMDMPAVSFFALLDALSEESTPEDWRRWKKLTGDQRADLMRKLLEKRQQQSEAENV